VLISRKVYFGLALACVAAVVLTIIAQPMYDEVKAHFGPSAWYIVSGAIPSNRGGSSEYPPDVLGGPFPTRESCDAEHRNLEKTGPVRGSCHHLLVSEAERLDLRARRYMHFNKPI
jgi:hypothetical protein